MGSQSLEILRQGIWASLTGGWFYDPHLDSFSNVFHLYVWLFLLCLPFTIYVFFPPTFYVWLTYCASIGTLFGTIKFINHALHNVYDTNECVEEPGPCVCQKKTENEKQRVTRSKCHDRCQDQVDLGIELQVLNGKTDTPPVECSSRNSYIEQNLPNGDGDSITSDYHRDKQNSTIDLKVEIHRKNSSESSEETQQLNKPIILNINNENDNNNELVSSSLQEHEPRLRNKMNEWRLKRQKCVVIAEEDRAVSRKLCRHASEDSQSRHTKQGTLGKTGSESRIKQTSSLELEQHNEDYPYWKSNQSVRRLTSTSNQMDNNLTTDHPQSLEVISKKSDMNKIKMPTHPQSLEVIAKKLHQQLVHPQSLETIGATNKNTNSSDDNNLPLYPQSLETINTKKSLPQNTLKRNQLQLLPYLSYGSEIVHPIAEQSDEQFTNDNAGGFNLRSSYSPLLNIKKIGDNGACSSRDRSLSTGGFEETFSSFNGEIIIDGDSVNSREALIDGSKKNYKRRFSNASQSSHELSDNDRQKDTQDNHSCKLDDPINSGSIVGIDWLFKNSDYGVEPWANKNFHGKEPDSGSSSTTTLSIDNEVKRTLLPQPIITDTKRNQGAIPKQNRPKISNDNLHDTQSSIINEPSSLITTTTTTATTTTTIPTTPTTATVSSVPPITSTTRSTKVRRLSETRRNHNRTKEQNYQKPNNNNNNNSNNNELSILLSKPVPPLLESLIKSDNQSSSSNNGMSIDTVAPGRIPVQNLSRRNRQRRLKRHHRPHRGPRHQQRDDNFAPIAALVGLMTNGECHLATNHNDTSEGAVHCFRDDNGHLFAYTFDEKGSGIATTTPIPIGNNDKLINKLLRQQINHNNHQYDGNWDIGESLNNSYSSLSLNSAGLTVIIDTPPPSTATASSSSATAVQLQPQLQLQQSVESSPGNNNNNNNNNNNTNINIAKLQSPNIVPGNNNNNNNNNNNSYNGLHFTQGVMLEPEFFRMITERYTGNRNLIGNINNQQLNTLPISGLPVQSHQDTDINTSLSWNRFIDGLDGQNDIKLKQTRHYYNWKIINKLPTIKLRFDRLSLLALLDKNLTIIETIISIILALFVGGLGLKLLQEGFYRDIYAFFFCFVTAGCQYSLLKSVQPDSASPTHGFNRIIVFSRPFYYIIVSSIILILNETSKNFKNSEFKVYGFCISDYDTIIQTRNIFLIFLLSFPILFSLGLFPQINTFIMYIFEHFDIHLFGGTATTGLVSSIYCISRSLLTVALLFAFAYGALTEPKSSQHILFSIFAGLLVAVSYHLSRSSSDPSVIWDIVKRNLIQVDDLKIEESEAKIIENTSKKDSAISSTTIYTKDHHKIRQNNNNNSRKKDVKIKVGEQLSDTELIDPLPNKLRSTVKARLKNDIIVCCLIGVLSFIIHFSTLLTILQPELNLVLWGIVSCLGFILHYIVPQLRKQLPWLCLARPVLRSNEYALFEVREPVKIMWYERVYVCLCFIERNILYPIVFLTALTDCSSKIIMKYGDCIGALIIVICGLKSIRSSYADSSSRYLILIFSVLFFNYDLKDKNISETFLVDYFITSILFTKIYELLLKIRFVVTYIAPWQVTWGSAFHAFAQPFSVPHSAMLFLQTIISAIFSTPLNPLLGSAIFICSYVRPVKFWERNYNTKRVDHSNTRMSSHLERNLGADDNNLNSIFYEQLTRSLQHSLYGDLALGRWGSIEQGDCFLLASDYLNCLVHIIQYGNGLVTFQLRGLEFRGTYCQQREVEAISESIEENDNCCCCEMGHFTNVLSMNAAFGQRWLAWEVASSKYVLEGYSISDNSAGSMLQVFDFRKVLVTYYVKSIIYYAIKSQKLKKWIDNNEINGALKLTMDKNFVDLDPVFNMNIDEDFDYRASGITRSSFCNVYLDWIQYCSIKNDKLIDRTRDSFLVSLCLSLSLLGRRVLGAASHNTVSSVEFFLYGLHALFKGDFRITSIRDEWVLHDVDLLKSVVAKGVRMALKLHQDHFMSPEQYEEPSALFEAIDNHDRHLVISHEADPLWRNAVLSGAPSLLALRHILDDGIDEYKVIMLNKRYLSFRVIKMNRECVRGLWAGQQQELIYLRNRNPERGSIQNAKQALRNIINSSCDQPIGYPIYVSPLTTSYAETNEQLCSIVGGPISLNAIKLNILKFWRKMRRKCGQGCSSGGTASQDDGGFGTDGGYAMTTYNIHSGYSQSGHNTSASQSMDSGCQIGGSTGRGSLGRVNTGSLGGNRGSLASVGKPTSSTLASLAGLLSNNDMKIETKCETSFTNKTDKDDISQRVRIMDPNQVYDAINLGRRIDVIWPDERMRMMGGRLGWQHWIPERGMEGCVVHRWIPNHRDPNKRSHVDKVILLVKIDDKYVPIAEQGVRDLGAEV